MSDDPIDALIAAEFANDRLNRKSRHRSIPVGSLRPPLDPAKIQKPDPSSSSDMSAPPGVHP
jgi:hypothetical protein